ncbi:RNA polymerase sigma factor [Prevotella sp. HUN102]|uniref:RNA polymerase sigma factor n=1 Tax=Prevotella sp. HUN102 TaxID=1392486 RepID=UPI000490FF21|nr:RNA polymerase sigma factor [Prevotella sp. HUN102]
MIKKDEKEEAGIAEGLLKRDASAMRTFYNQYAGIFLTICARYVSDSDDAKDVLQEAFIKIFTRIGSFEYRGSGSLFAWSKQIVVMEALTFLRKKKTVPLVYEEQLPEQDDESELTVEDVPEEMLLQMIQLLPEGYRLVFNLYVLENKSHKEIGEILGIREKSSASQLSRAKAILKKQINSYRKGLKL